LAVVFWIWTDITHGFVSDPALKLVVFYLKYAFLATIPALWLGTCFRLVGQRSRVTLVAEGTYWVVAAALILMLIFDPVKHWFFSDLELPSGSWTFVRHNGPGYYTFMVLLFGALGLGIALLVRHRHQFSSLDFRRTGLILWGAGLVDMFRLIPDQHMALVPWAILVTAALFLVAALWGKLFVPVPMAYEIVVQKMPDPVVVMNSTRKPVWFNEVAKELFSGFSSDLARGLIAAVPELEDQFDHLRSGGEIVVRIHGKEYRVQGAQAQDQRSGFEAQAFVFHDVTGLKDETNRLEALVEERTGLLHRSLEMLKDELLNSQEAQIRLERTLSEKELLLQEVNHRVKNNLQIIMSLINLQARRLPKGSLMAESYAATQGRIRSISLVHELIYRTEFGAGLDFRSYLEELVQGISALYAQQDARVEILPSSRPVQGGVDFSVDFGLVVNELVTNAFKHGIVPAGGGVVTIGLELEGSTLVLQVRDSGAGFAPHDTEGASLGLSLVRTMLKKYKAELVIRSDQGSVVEVRIPWEDL
jgi:two-component sensor histidine kinase